MIFIVIHEFVTGGGFAGSELPASWAAEGSAMRRALASDFAAIPGVRVTMTLDARLPDEPGPWTIERVRSADDEPETLARLAGQADEVVLVAPETDGILADRARRINRSGALSLGSAPESIELCGDKARLERWLRDRGWPAPESRILRPSSDWPADATYPAILKPIDGAGCIDTYRIEGPDRIPDEVRRLEAPMLLQAELEGEPRSACLLIADNGEATGLAMGRQWIERDSAGRLSYRGGAAPIGPVPSLIVEAAGSVAGLRGFVGVDFLWQADGERATILEINPRLTTSYVGLRRLVEPGTIANAWRSAVRGEGLGPSRALAEDLARCYRSPIHFRAED